MSQYHDREALIQYLREADVKLVILGFRAHACLPLLAFAAQGIDRSLFCYFLSIYAKKERALAGASGPEGRLYAEASGSAR